MKGVVAAFNQEKGLVEAFSVITNLRMELFEALLRTVPPWFPSSPPRHFLPDYTALQLPGDARTSHTFTRVSATQSTFNPFQAILLLVMSHIHSIGQQQGTLTWEKDPDSGGKYKGLENKDSKQQNM